MKNVEALEYKRTAKKACKENKIIVSMKNMILLETGFNGLRIDYVMFEDIKTNTQYQCFWGAYNPITDSLWTVSIYK